MPDLSWLSDEERAVLAYAAYTRGEMQNDPRYCDRDPATRRALRQRWAAITKTLNPNAPTVNQTTDANQQAIDSMQGGTSPVGAGDNAP